MSLLTATAPSSLAARWHVPLRRVAWWAIVLLSLVYGLGDIAQINTANSVLLNGVHALSPVAIGLTLASAALSGRVVSVPRGLVVGSVAWLAILILSALLAPSHRAEALVALSRPIWGVLLAWSVCQLCTSATRWRRLMQALAIGGLCIAILALAEAAQITPIQIWLDSLQDADVPIGDVPRAAATLSHPNEAAMLLELSLPFLVAWIWSTNSRWRPMLFLAAACTLGALVLTFSRAGLVALLLSLTLLAVVGGRGRARLISLGMLGLVVPLTLGWAALADPGLDRRLLAGLDESSASQPPRSEFWAVATHMVRDQPLLGVGPDNFRWRFANYSGLAEDNLGIHAHNQYLEALADTGVVGFAAFITFTAMLVGVAAARCGRSPWRAALLASLIAWLLHALLDDFERFWPTSVAFWIVVGLIASDYPARWVSPLMRSAVPRARVSSSPVTLPRPSSTEPLI